MRVILVYKHKRKRKQQSGENISLGKMKKIQLFDFGSVCLRDNANDLNLTWMTRGQATEARTNPTIQIRKGWVKPGWYLRDRKLCLRNKKNFICHNRWAKQSLQHSIVTSAVKVFLIIFWIHSWPCHCLMAYP